MPTFRPRPQIGSKVGYYVGLFSPDPRPTPFPPRTEVPFEIVVYDKTFKRVGWVGGYQSFTATLRHNQISTAEIVVDLRHPRVADLMAPGARAVINYDGKFLLSGTCRLRSGNGPQALGTLTFSITSDFSKLSELVAWPAPTQPITNQGAVSKFYIASGPAETVVKSVMRANVNRLDSPYFNMTIAADQGRGDDIKVMLRMDMPFDKLFPFVDQAGIGVSVRQSGAGFLLDCYEPTVRTRVLSEASGALVDWSWTQADPVATRLVLGGAGEGTSRQYRIAVDGPREASLGTVIEAYRDANDVGSDYETALRDVKDRLADVEKARPEYSKSLAIWKMQTKIVAGLLETKLDLQAASTSAANAKKAAADALADGPASGTQHDHLQDAYDKAADAASAAADRVASITSRIADANGDLAEALADRNAADAALTAANTAYSAAVTKRNAESVKFEAAMVVFGKQALLEADATYGLALTLAETNTFKYGRTLNVGDSQPVELAPGVVVTDVCREVSISHTVEDGVTVVPTVGSSDNNDPSKVVISAVQRLGKMLRTLKTGR